MPTTIRLPNDLKARVAAAAKRAGTTAHSFILEAICWHAHCLGLIYLDKEGMLLKAKHSFPLQGGKERMGVIENTVCLHTPIPTFPLAGGRNYTTSNYATQGVVAEDGDG